MQPTLADFDLLTLVGQGSSGRVYRARERSSGQSVALKVVKKGLFSDERTLLEQSLQLSLSGSPFVLPLLASWHDSVNFYLVSPFCGGHDLDYNLSIDGRFSEDRARFYAAELLVALQHFKDEKVLHRDIKPANILLTASGHVRLIDLGLATKLKASPITEFDFKVDPTACSGSFTIHDPDFTSAERVGTPSYMCAEQHIGRPYSYEADLHGLGVSLYQMITGRLPFGVGAKSREEMAEAVCCEHLVFRPEDKVSPEARDLLSQLLGRNSRSPAQLEEVMQHPWFASIRWDRVRSQAGSPSWRPYLSPPPKNTTVIEVDEGVPCSPDPYPSFTYTSPDFDSMQIQGDRTILKRISRLFSRDQSPSSPGSPSSISSSMSASPPKVREVPQLLSPSAFSSIASDSTSSESLSSSSLLFSSTSSGTFASPLAKLSLMISTTSPSTSPPPIALSPQPPTTKASARALSTSAFRAAARRSPPPFPPPTIPLPPIPTDVEPFRPASLPDPSVARGDLPPLHIRRLLNKRIRQPPVTIMTPMPEGIVPEIVWPEGIVPEVVWPEGIVPEVVWPEGIVPEVVVPEVITPEVIITPADDEVMDDLSEPTPGLREPLRDVSNLHYLSPSDAERPAFNPVLKPGPRIKLSAPPKRAKRAQKENASLQLRTLDEVQSQTTVVARTPPTAVFMLPPKSVPLPLVMPTTPLPKTSFSAPLQTPKKTAVKATPASQPSVKKVQAKSAKSVPLTSVTPSAPPPTPKRAASKLQLSPKSATPKVKPAFKVPAKVAEPKLGTPSSSVRMRNTLKASTPASVSSAGSTNDDEGIYPRPLVRADALSHPALAFADAVQKPASYPRPPEAQPKPPAPLQPLSIAEAFAPPPRSPPGPKAKAAPKHAAPEPEPRFTSAPQACIVPNPPPEVFHPAALAAVYGSTSTMHLDLDPEKLKQRAAERVERARASAIKDIRESPYLSARAPSPPIAAGPHYAGYLPGPSPTGIISELRRMWIRFSMAVSRVVSWFRYRNEPGFVRY